MHFKMAENHFYPYTPELKPFAALAKVWLEDCKLAGLEFVCLERLSQLGCLHNRPVLWETTHMVIYLHTCLANSGVWEGLCIHWEMLWRSGRTATGPAPFDATSLNSYNNAW